MADKKSSDIVITQQGGMIKDILLRLKLILRLMGDRRVNLFAKLIPIATLVYLFSPDPLMIPVIGIVDDAALLWLGSYIFTELCPPEVVQEHLKALAGNLKSGTTDEDVVDAETTEVSDTPEDEVK
ncbi:MAG: hypothetical protein FJZ87_01450 [Chloroflexi bacterium]|nr:hypothetical protein [Chloroflexota bacterium]